MNGNTKELKWELTSEGENIHTQAAQTQQHQCRYHCQGHNPTRSGLVPRWSMTRRSVSHLESRRNEIGHKALQMYDMHSTG